MECGSVILLGKSNDIVFRLFFFLAINACILAVGYVSLPLIDNDAQYSSMFSFSLDFHIVFVIGKLQNSIKNLMHVTVLYVRSRMSGQ